MIVWHKAVPLALTVLVLGGCSTMKVKLTGDPGLSYQAAWTDNTGNHTETGLLPATFRIKDDRFVGWFRNTTSSGEFRVRVYRRGGLMVDRTVVNSAERVNVEMTENGVAVTH